MSQMELLGNQGIQHDTALGNLVAPGEYYKVPSRYLAPSLDRFWTFTKCKCFVLPTRNQGPQNHTFICNLVALVEVYKVP